MNLSIKYLIEQTVLHFNPSILRDKSSHKTISQDIIDNSLYYYPKDKEELIKCIRLLLDNGISDLNCINTSEITDFSHLFYLLGLPTELQSSLDVSEWDVSSGINFSHMFNQCHYFNCDLSNWDVSSGVDFSYMFAYNFRFNQDLSRWNIKNGEDFNHMFFECKDFDLNLSNWEFKDIANIRWMFKNCPINKTFKQPKKSYNKR